MYLYSWDHPGFHSLSFSYIPRNLAKSFWEEASGKLVLCLASEWPSGYSARSWNLGTREDHRKVALRSSPSRGQDLSPLGCKARGGGSFSLLSLRVFLLSWADCPFCVHHACLFIWWISFPLVGSHISRSQNNEPANCQEVFFTPGWPVGSNHNLRARKIQLYVWSNLS